MTAGRAQWSETGHATAVVTCTSAARHLRQGMAENASIHIQQSASLGDKIRIAQIERARPHRTQVPARLEARRDSLHPIEIKPVTCGTAVYRRYISNCGSQHRIPENDSRTASLSCKASLSLKKCIDKAHAYSGIYRLPTAVAAVSNNGMVKEIGFFGGRICRRMPAVFAKQSLRES